MVLKYNITKCAISNDTVAPMIPYRGINKKFIPKQTKPPQRLVVRK